MYCTLLIGQVREQRNYSSWYCRISCTSVCISRINFWHSILTIITFVLDKPGKPGTPEVKDSDKDFIEIEWDPPRKDGGAPITGYNVERKDPRTGRWNKVNRDPVTVSRDFNMIQTIHNHHTVVCFHTSNTWNSYMSFLTDTKLQGWKGTAWKGVWIQGSCNKRGWRIRSKRCFRPNQSRTAET